MLHENPTESQTRKAKIDGLLDNAGWNPKDRSKVIEEFEIDGAGFSGFRIAEEKIIRSNLKSSQQILLNKP
jgi:type I site-specific restriction endonuclease